MNRLIYRDAKSDKYHWSQDYMTITVSQRQVRQTAIVPLVSWITGDKFANRRTQFERGGCFDGELRTFTALFGATKRGNLSQNMMFS